MSPPATVDDPWYTDPRTAWVDPASAVERPHRYADLFHAPTQDGYGRPLSTTSKSARKAAGSREAPAPWHAVLVLSPSCDVISKSGGDSLVLVARVKDLSQQSGPQQAAIAAGWKLGPHGPQVAFARFAYVPAVPNLATHPKHMYADFGETVWVRYADLAAAGRIAVADHDARVALIRREIYYKYRWLVPMAEVRAAEAARITGDDAYEGPRPAWATGPT